VWGLQILRQPSTPRNYSCNSRPFWQSSQLSLKLLRPNIIRFAKKVHVPNPYAHGHYDPRVAVMSSTKPLGSSNMVLVQTLTNNVLLLPCVQSYHRSPHVLRRYFFGLLHHTILCYLSTKACARPRNEPRNRRQGENEVTLSTVRIKSSPYCRFHKSRYCAW
jgi:hypothetical protein